MTHAQPPISAQIIAFPTRQATPPPVNVEVSAPAETPVERMQRALTLLAAAQQEQKEALARWREAISALQGSLQGLGASIHRTRDNPARISSPTAP